MGEGGYQISFTFFIRPCCNPMLQPKDRRSSITSFYSLSKHPRWTHKGSASKSKEAGRMKKLLASSLALAALGLAAPMRAETVYVPVVEPVNAAGAPLATQLWISNFG